MRRALVAVLGITGVVLVCGVVVYRFALDLTWIDAIYFVVTTSTTVGYGDFNLHDAPPALKLFGTLLMVAGVAGVGALFGIITDAVLGRRLQEYLGIGRRRMRDHVVLCGLGNVGFRVLEHLRRLGETVVIVERDEDCRFVPEARRVGATIIVGDMRLSAALERAGVPQAKALVAASDNDLANLEAALNARALNDHIRIVLRMFDQTLADKVRAGFGLETAFSTSALAAPAFATAAVDPRVVGSFYVGDDLMLNLRLTVREGTSLAAMTTRDLERKGGVSVLAHHAASGARTLHPSDAVPLAPGDVIVVSATADATHTLDELNAT